MNRTVTDLCAIGDLLAGQFLSPAGCPPTLRIERSSGGRQFKAYVHHFNLNDIPSLSPCIFLQVTDPRTYLTPRYKCNRLLEGRNLQLSTLTGIIQCNQSNRIGGSFFTKHTPYQCVSYSSIRRISEPPPQLPRPYPNPQFT